MQDQASKSKALDDITNTITEKRKKDSNNDYKNEFNEEIIRKT